MNKRHQRVDDIYETARKAQIAGIRINFNLILGYPGETEADRIETFQTMSDIVQRYDNVQFSPNLFTPYPGIPIWPQLRELGVREPQTLEEWIQLPLSANALPWLKGEELERLKRMLDYFLLNGKVHRRHGRESLKNSGVRMLVKHPVRWRVRSSRYGFPWELWLSNLSGTLASRRSLVTGEDLPEQAAAC
jgi:anaerobic magnesium-protoporphyrin IX monomethyl ester cyclase